MDIKPEKNERNIPDALSSVWAEKVHVITDDYQIEGYVFMPKTGKKNRILSEILNGSRRFVAIKDAQITHKKTPDVSEFHEFIQLNLDTIILLRPADRT
ncbi:MAG: hypothetical protein ACD_20C00287G0009 [uncultured bacterium]|nr:MAG: hypothetical protein ACD_20C00287G0009 [uncultured bacterium]HBH18263.1 hypothetical protein [Cyanobacteria bacterium UBA9579]